MTFQPSEDMLTTSLGGPVRWFYLFLISSFVFVLDRITKFVIIKYLFQNQSMVRVPSPSTLSEVEGSIKILPNIFHITPVLNKGMAFGLFKDQRPLFVSISILAIAFIILYVWKNKGIKLITLISMGFILGGASGNLVDRIGLGYVIDFLDFRVWPVFNIADSSITIGASILILNILLRQNKKIDKGRT